MDTGTHLVVGLGLAGLSYIDPVIASDTSAATAVLIGTVLGSQAPDSDGLLRMKGNAAYIRNHRGITHSLPAIGLWSLLITAGLALVFPGLPVLHVGGWVLLAVGFHVFSDLFNTYGTQALRPISEKWIGWNIIHIFDPVIFVSHLIAIFMWSVHLFQPADIFSVLYSLLAVYYLWRTYIHFLLEKGLPKQDPHYRAGERYYLIPTIHLNHWNVLKYKGNGCYALGELKNEKLQWIDQVTCSDHPAAEASKTHPDIASFLYFSSFACAEVKQHRWGYEVRWADVRYRHRKQYPFVAVLLCDHQMRPMDSYVGWLSDTRLEKKMHVNSHG